MSPLTTKVVYCLAKQCHHISLVMKASGAILSYHLSRSLLCSYNSVLVWLAIIPFSLCVPAMRHSWYNNGKCGDIFIVCTQNRESLLSFCTLLFSISMRNVKLMIVRFFFSITFSRPLLYCVYVEWGIVISMQAINDLFVLHAHRMLNQALKST